MKKFKSVLIGLLIIALLIGGLPSLLLPHVVLAADTGATYPGLGSTEDRDGKSAWSNPTNIQAEVGYSLCSVAGSTYSDWLRASDFGFTIHSTTTINGIKVEINRTTSMDDVMKDSSLRLVDASGTNVGDDKASASYWPILPATATYGGDSDTWGASPTPAMVNDSDFGVRLSVANDYGVNKNAYVYWVKITVYYTLHAPTVDTLAVTDIGSVSFTGNADIIDDGGATVTRRGFVHAEGLKYALDFNGVSDYVEIPYLADYYSNTAAVETFEWGIDTDPLDDDGGSVDWTLTLGGASKAEIDIGQKYQGTRSARFYRDGAENALAYFSQTAVASGQSIEFWGRTDGDSFILVYHGNGSKFINMGLSNTEQVGYNDGSWHYYGSTPAETWYALAIRNVNWVAGTYDIYLSGSIIVSGAVMREGASVANLLRFQNGGSAASNCWVDSILVCSPSVWTFETWINRKKDNATWERLISYSDDLAWDRYIQIQPDDTVASGFTDTTGTSRGVVTTDTIPLNTDIHLVTTFDGTYVRIYINGVLKATSASFAGKIPRNSNLPLQIGRILTSYNFEGAEDDIRIWEDVRTQDEIQANMYAELVGTEAGLVGYWKLNEGTGTTAEDSTVNANDGAITGADWVYQSWDLGCTKIIYSSISDGDFVGMILGGSYYDVWSAATEDAIVDDLEILHLGQSPDSEVPYEFYIWRTCLYFDTSSIPEHFIITSASIGLYGYQDLTTTTFSVVVQNGQPTYPHDPMEAGDYNKDNYSGDGGSISTSEWSTSGYNVIDLNEDGISWINRGGQTKFMLRSSRDISGTEPTDLNRVGARTSERGGTSEDPYLYLTYNIVYEDGSFGEGEYNLTIEDLTPSTWYRVRGFAVNSEGIGYGDVVVAETLIILLPPTNLAATDGAHTDKVVLTWTKSDTATGYKIYENGNLLDTVGDIAIWDDMTAPAPTITPGTASASDGTSTLYVILTVTDMSANNGTSRIYKTTALRGVEESDYSSTDMGYRSVGNLTYEWFRSTADSDTNFSSIAGEGGTTNPFNDYNGAVEPDGRYYYAKVSMVGAITQATTHDRGYMLIVILLPFPPYNLTVIQIDLDTMEVAWMKGYLANSTIIRIKVDEYPASITDGGEVYNGIGTNATYALTYSGIDPPDEEIYNLDNRTYYIRAWSENDVGYSIGYAETSIGGKLMTFIGILIFCGIASYLSMRNRFPLLKLLAGASWVAAFVYWMFYPPAPVEAGSPPHIAVMIIMVGLAIAIPLVGLSREVERQKDFSSGLDVETTKFSHFKLPNWMRSSEAVVKENREQKASEYREKLHKALNLPKKGGR